MLLSLAACAAFIQCPSVVTMPEMDQILRWARVGPLRLPLIQPIPVHHKTVHQLPCKEWSSGLTILQHTS